MRDDALCRKLVQGENVGDQVVNQLLIKIDGVEPLENVLVVWV